MISTTTISKEATTVILIALMGMMLVFFSGVTSNIYLGDEVYHFRVAKMMFEEKTRPVVDPLVHKSEVSQRKIMVAIFWHGLLAGIWLIIGKASQLSAQLYQSVYYFLLVIFAYILGVSCFDRKTGLLSALLIATIPMVGAYSMMLYLDVAIAFLSTLAFIIFFKKKYFWLGVVLGLMFITKRNSYFLFPFFFFYILFFSEGTFKERSKNEVLFLIPLFLLILPDLYFRYEYIGSLTHHPLVPPKFKVPKFWELGIVFIHPEDWVRNPANFVRYFGIPILVGGFLYIKANIKNWRASTFTRNDRILFAVIITYLAFYLYFFRGLYSPRYLSPIIPLVCILAANGFRHYMYKRKTLIWIFVVLVGCSQLIFALTYVHNQRTISQPIWDAYQYVKEKTPEDARLLATKPALSLYAGRQSIWFSDGSFPELGYLFWKANQAEIKGLMKYHGIDYIFVEKDRICDDSKIRDIKNYPLSFAKKLHHLTFLKQVFANDAVTIWKIDIE